MYGFMLLPRFGAHDAMALVALVIMNVGTATELET